MNPLSRKFTSVLAVTAITATMALASPAAAAVRSFGKTYTVTASDGTWSVDTGAASGTGTSTFTANGSNAVSVTATDAAGNEPQGRLLG